MSGAAMQKVLPGVNPLKALQTLPGVRFHTADPWGNNEQNLALLVHGFDGQQLGYTRRAPVVVQSFETAGLKALRKGLGKPSNVTLAQLVIAGGAYDKERPADAAAGGGLT